MFLGVAITGPDDNWSNLKTIRACAPLRNARSLSNNGMAIAYPPADD